MKRENKYKAVWDRLPSFDPPQLNWDKIDRQLDIQTKLQELPQFDPNEGQWKSMESKLNSHKRFSLQSISRWAAVITILVIMMAGLTWYSTDSKIRITTETQFNAIAFQTTDEGFDLSQICAELKKRCLSPQFKKLETELLELNTAKNEITVILSEFEDDDMLISKLMDIEVARSRIMREMITMI